MSDARVIDRLFFLGLQSKPSALAVWVVCGWLVAAMAGAASADPIFSAARSFDLEGGLNRVAMADVSKRPCRMGPHEVAPCTWTCTT